MALQESIKRTEANQQIATADFCTLVVGSQITLWPKLKWYVWSYT